MKGLEDYVSVLAFVLGSATGCNLSAANAPNISPKIGPSSYPEVRCHNHNISGEESRKENTTVCEYDVNGDGKVEKVIKEIRDRDNTYLKRLTDYGADGIYEKEDSFFYASNRSLIKHIINEGNKTSVHEYADGKIKRDLYDSDSDGNFETIFIYNENGTVTYLGDENDDGLPEIISEEVDANYASRFDPDGNEGIVYKRILKLSKDLDLNGKFDRIEFIFIKPDLVDFVLVQELVLYDKNQDGFVDVIRKKEYDPRNILVSEKWDWDGDKKWDSVWRLGEGWTDYD